LNHIETQYNNNITLWINKLDELKIYIDNNHRKPNKINENKKIRTLNRWMTTQLTNSAREVGLMKNNNIKKLWIDFLTDNKYKHYFSSYAFLFLILK